ncbi:hypothetical protein D3C71_1760810 [compost metagenome]
MVPDFLHVMNKDDILFHIMNGLFITGQMIRTVLIFFNPPQHLGLHGRFPAGQVVAAWDTVYFF